MNRRMYLVLFVACTLGPAAASAQETPFVRDVFGRINAQRKQHRLSTLVYDKTLEKAAQAHAVWMARRKKMEHLQAPPAFFDEHRTCNHHPVNRAVNAGYIEWDEVFRVEKTPTGAGRRRVRCQGFGSAASPHEDTPGR